MSRRRHDRHARHDRGESLIEILVSVALLGIAAAAIMGAVVTASRTSSLHRHQAQSQNLLRNWAEAVSLVPNNAAYQPCATPVPPAVPAGFPAPTSAVKWWNGTAFVPLPSPCVAANNNGVTLYRLTITAPGDIGTAALSQSLDVIVRKPCGVESPASPCS